MHFFEPDNWIAHRRDHHETLRVRALATRYDKLAITCRAAVLLSACITLTRL
jgi:transposase